MRGRSTGTLLSTPHPVGVVIAIVYIAPAGTSPAAVFEPFGIMLVVTATYALVWTKFVRRVPLFNPLPVEEVLAKEFAAAPSTVDQTSASTPATISSAAAPLRSRV